MPSPKLSDEAFITEFQLIGAAGIAKKYDILENGVYHRRRRIEAKLGHSITAPSKSHISYPGRVNHELRNVTVLIGSDFHIWPGEESTCLRAFKKFTDDIKPNIVILNGDVMDFPRISRHPQNWETAPDPQEEIEAAQDHLQDIVSRCKRGAQKLWTLGNHDARFETRLAATAPEFQGIKGFHLKDHFLPYFLKIASRKILRIDSNPLLTFSNVKVNNLFSGKKSSVVSSNEFSVRFS